MAIKDTLPPIKPTLMLDFANAKALDPRITFSRASTATYCDEKGAIQTAPAGVPRFDHDPITGECKGLLIEESRTNLVRYSGDLSLAPWGDSVSASIAPETFSGIPFWTLAKTTTNTSEGRMQWLGAVAAGNTLTATIALMAGSVDAVSIGLYDVTADSWGANADMAMEIISGPGALSVWAGALINVTGLSPTVPTLFRVTRTYLNACTAIFTIYPGTPSSKTIGSSVKATRVQVEAGAFATSYIPTNVSAVTRAADAVTITGASFTSWYNSAEGTFFVDVPVRKTGSVRAAFGVGVPLTGNPNTIAMWQTNAANSAAVISQGQVEANTVMPSTLFCKSAISYKRNSIVGAAGGLIGAEDTACNVPAVTFLQIGNMWESAGTYVLNGSIKRLTYYPKRLTNSQLQALTA